MKKYEQILKDELNKYKSRLPKGDGTLTGLSNRLGFIKDNTKKFEKTVNDSANKYIQDNNLNESEIENVKKISVDYFSKFIGLIS